MNSKSAPSAQHYVIVVREMMADRDVDLCVVGSREAASAVASGLREKKTASGKKRYSKIEVVKRESVITTPAPPPGTPQPITKPKRPKKADRLAELESRLSAIEAMLKGAQS